MFASFSEKIVRMGYSAQQLLTVCLEALAGGGCHPQGSRVVDGIEMKFQRLPHVSGIQQLSGSSLDAL
jgi:hypothetical protein